MNGTKRPRAVVAPLLGGLVALALVLLAPRASASVPRAGEMVAPVERISASVLETSLDLSALERALTPAADVTEAPLFTLGDVALDDTEREPRFVLGPMQLVDVEALRGPPESYPETRIRAFAFLGSTLIGVSRGVSLDLLPGYERIELGLADGDVVNLYAYVGLQPQAAVDPMGEAFLDDAKHVMNRAMPTIVKGVAIGFAIGVSGPFAPVLIAGMTTYAAQAALSMAVEASLSPDPGATMLGLTADVTGARSVYEAATGKELGSGRALSREERLDAIGDVIGDVGAAVAGGAAVRAGQGARGMVASARNRGGTRHATATGRRAGAESHEGHARGGTRDHGAEATSRPTHSANEAMDGAAKAARKMDDGIGCPFRSFSPDTLVATALGLIPIDQVAPGTEVWAADEETGERSLRKVSSTAFHLAEDGLLLTVGGETLRTTAEHPFFTAGGEWVEAGRLQVGQEVRSLDGELLRVEKLEKRDGRFAVFNFEVDEDHSYFVGDAGLLVHNCGSRSIGRLGEDLVENHLRSKGYADIQRIQNRSGHGIDFVAKNRAGQMRYFEVKTSTTGTPGHLSRAQSGMRGFVRSRLERAASPIARGWRGVSPSLKRTAGNLLDEMDAGSPVRGIKVDVMLPRGAVGPPTLRFGRWE